ncbi:MAG: hypothetical protein FJ077_09710 [Cyanobacteria bacterium K_DeepCast_35m_m2_023]|nr:hypothetical protein [Cyanobacteria bacterium K_DeepCast_35m_m2_023]
MATIRHGSDTTLASLPLPIPSAGADFTVTAADVMGEGKTLGGGQCITLQRSACSRLECSFIDISVMSLMFCRRRLPSC